jgi:site-specific DNA-cytosine methylase
LNILGAALSQLNTGKTPESKGAGCQKNEWMYRVFEDAIDLFDCDVVMIENAPALFTNKGRDVAHKLFELCAQRGYSLSLYKTTTSLHGIPQNRDRTFAFGWKSSTSPVLNWYDRDRVSFQEYLRQIGDDELHQNNVINPKVINEPYYNFIKVRTNRDPRELLIAEDIKTTFNYVMNHNLLDEAIKWFYDTNNELGIKLSEHAKKKFADGKGIWDGSVHVFGDCMNAVIGRNMVDTIHPEFDRSLTVREALHLMGFPKDFELLGTTNKIGHIAQNVPTCTARDMTYEAIKFLKGGLQLSESNYVRQNNHSQKTEYDPLGTTNNTSIEHFFDLQTA